MIVTGVQIEDMKRYPWYWMVMIPISGSGICSLLLFWGCYEVARSHSMHFWKCCSFVTVTWGNYFLSLMIKLLKDCSSSPGNVQLQRKREGYKYIHCPYDQAEFLCPAPLFPPFMSYWQKPQKMWKIDRQRMEPWCCPDSGHQTSSKKHQTLASLVLLLPLPDWEKDNVGEKFLKFSLELNSNPAVSKVYKV